MAYSSGFNPHPRISYANAAPTSAASEAEYVELGLAQRCAPEKVVDALNEALPAGFVMLDAADAVRESLGDLLQVSEWEVSLPGAELAVLRDVVQRFWDETEHQVERMTKHGMRTFDVRAVVLSCEAEEGLLRMRIRHQTPLVRPDDVVTALRMLEPRLPAHPLLQRTQQGPLAGDEIGDPLRP